CSHCVRHYLFLAGRGLLLKVFRFLGERLGIAAQLGSVNAQLCGFCFAPHAGCFCAQCPGLGSGCYKLGLEIDGQQAGVSFLGSQGDPQNGCLSGAVSTGAALGPVVLALAASDAGRVPSPVLEHLGSINNKTR
ncbi:MAG: hypothetical protein RR574_18810, partial [Comamonas sp.]